MIFRLAQCLFAQLAIGAVVTLDEISSSTVTLKTAETVATATITKEATKTKASETRTATITKETPIVTATSTSTSLAPKATKLAEMPNLFSDQVFPIDTVTYGNRNFTIEISGNKALVWGDVIFATIQEADETTSSFAEPLLTQGGRALKVNPYFEQTVKVKRGASVHGVRAWPNRRVPYYFETGVPSGMMDVFRRAAWDWGSGADLDIIESRENGAIRVVAQEQGCNSHIGYTGYNEIGLGYAGNNACGFNYGIVAHELGHALGLIHEHQRSDRDQHIRIWPEHSSMDPQRFAANWNIEPNTWGITPYDAISIMHYPPEHWSQSWGVVWRSIIILPSDPYYDYLAMQEIRQGDFDAVRSIHSGEVRGGRPQPGNGIGNYQQCPNGGTDQCSSGGFRCCIGPGDSQTGKFTCRPGNECFRGGLVPDYQTCPSFTDSCATPGFRCCVGFADAVSAATRKHTCRPNNECANGGVVPNYETCPAGERDNCATPGFRCCVGSGDASTGKLTCRPGNECLRGGVVPNYQTCPAGKADKCANAGFTCCVGAGDIGTGKHTCRPFGECT